MPVNTETSTWLRKLVDNRRSRRARIERETTLLITFLGEMAYNEARYRARACRTRADRDGERLWSRVAVTIARRTGYEIGVKAADRYEEDANGEGRARDRYRHEVALATRAILSGRPAARCREAIEER